MKCKFKIISYGCLIAYVALVLYNTVLSRMTKLEYRYDFQPGWSYVAIMNGKVRLIHEIILNIVMFIPLGILLWHIMKQKSWMKAMAYSCAFSISIEVMQLILKRGFCELDDVIHNMFGCLLGFGACYLLRGIRMNAS